MWSVLPNGTVLLIHTNGTGDDKEARTIAGTVGRCMVVTLSPWMIHAGSGVSLHRTMQRLGGRHITPSPTAPTL